MTNPYWAPQQPRLPSEFRMAGGFGKLAAPFVAVLVVFFLVTLLLGSALTRSVVGGIGIGAAGTLILVVVLYGKFSRMRTGTVVRFSVHGVELSDTRGFQVWLRWPDITRVGTVHTQLANPKSVGVEGGTTVTVGAMRSLGLIGWGERVVPPNIPDWMRATLAAQPVNPMDGRPEVTIPLGSIDPRWQEGAMGAWVRMYRPDLLPPVGGSRTAEVLQNLDGNMIVCRE